MISDLQQFFAATVSLMKTPFTLYGFTFSWWEVFFWSIVAGLIIWFVRRLFND